MKTMTMRWLHAGVLAFSVTAIGCPDDEPSRTDTGPTDTTDAQDTSDGSPDGDDPGDITPDAPDPGDTSAPDTDDTSASDTDDTSRSDTDDAGDTGADTEPSDVTVAAPGERCTLAERVGLIEIEEISSEPPTFYAFGAIEDRPNPWYGAPELATDACEFHRFDPTGACPPCGPDELCGIDGTCTKAPVRYLDAAITLENDAGRMRLAADPVTGDMWGQVDVPGRAFAVEVAFAGHRVTLPLTESPGSLDDVSGTLEGGYDAPERLDLAWATKVAGSHVYTRIPINHHAAGPTFTECTVPASTSALTIEEDMLAPLAIITGLEFQGLEHTRFAAAHTPLGCVELRFIVRHFVSL